jgi:hypothetical protein
MMKTTMMKIAAMGLALGLLAGCASTDQLTKMEADIVKAQETADAAAKAARQAQLDAASDRLSWMLHPLRAPRTAP